MTDIVARTSVYTTIIITLVIWSLPWKAIALWKAARRKATIWYIALLIINTVGILEILYIFIFCNKQEEK